MIVGLMLMSIITAQVSSTLTADNLQPLGDVFGKKVGRLLELYHDKYEWNNVVDNTDKTFLLHFPWNKIS